jgi:hypothetical protein
MVSILATHVSLRLYPCTYLLASALLPCYLIVQP